MAFRNRLFFEAIVERWFYLCPTVIKKLGIEAEYFHAYMYGWIDLAIHALDPSTETIERETYQPIHVSSPNSQRFTTPERYALQLVVYDITFEELQGLDNAWYFALETSCPYFEDTDLASLEDREKSPMVRVFRQKVLGAFVEALSTHTDALNAIKPIAVLWADTIQGEQAEVDCGRRFYHLLFSGWPELIDYFTDTDSKLVVAPPCFDS